MDGHPTETHPEIGMVTEEEPRGDGCQVAAAERPPAPRDAPGSAAETVAATSTRDLGGVPRLVDGAPECYGSRRICASHGKNRSPPPPRSVVA